MANRQQCTSCGSEDIGWVSNCDNCGKKMPEDESRPFAWRWRVQIQTSSGYKYGPNYLELCRECGTGLFSNLKKASAAMDRIIEHFSPAEWKEREDAD